MSRYLVICQGESLPQRNTVDFLPCVDKIYAICLSNSQCLFLSSLALTSVLFHPERSIFPYFLVLSFSLANAIVSIV